MQADTKVHASVTGVVVVFLVDLKSNQRSGGWLKLVQGTSALMQLPGVVFAKVMGSGHEGGFGLRPSPTHQGLVMVFDNFQHAQEFLNSETIDQYKSHAREWWSGVMVIDSSRGQWNQLEWRSSEPMDESLQERGVRNFTWIATLTRASIRAASTMAFWRFAPAAQADLTKAKGCILAMGLGEAPLLRQCTFSVWRDTQSMLNYAQTGAHLNAIQAAYKHQFFSESMFVRMRVLSVAGIWGGVHYG